MNENKKKILGGITYVEEDDTHFWIKYDTGEEAKLTLLNDHTFRFQMAPDGVFSEHPLNSSEQAKIIIKDENHFNFHIEFKDMNAYFNIETEKLQIRLDRMTGCMKVQDTITEKDVIIEAEPLVYGSKCTQTLHQRYDEYFFGGGMQNGRYNHKGKVIFIQNTNKWTEGGVSSPCPFYWSSYGYGVLRNTWKKGQYDFSGGERIQTTHEDVNFDAYFFINSKPRDILRDYYDLTGKPILMPEYAYYQAHLNKFNRYYCAKTYEIDSTAQAMIEKYKRYDLPLGWFIPNDGYGQPSIIDDDIDDLKSFIDYANKNNVEVAISNASTMNPDNSSQLEKRESVLKKQLNECNIVGLKYVGSENSFDLSVIEEISNTIIENRCNCVRPMMLTVNGWAGTQRYSGIWSGNQEGGIWENVRCHIPSYIGSGLSGLPVVGSDIDGIFGGGDKDVNIRDYQWKSFTPLQLNMDDWGSISKTPFSFDEEAIYINRAYLKLKSILMPYNYSIGYESTCGLPMVRAMLLEYPHDISTYTNVSQYQYMWGPSFLVAPIYNEIKNMGNSIRNGIYLPDETQVWIDFFTGEKYQGGKIYNNMVAPLWKLPLFIKDGSIIPMTKPNNNPKEMNRAERIFVLYPNGETKFDVYEDDGVSLNYIKGHSATTTIYMNGPKTNFKGNLLIIVNPTTRFYSHMIEKRSTVLKIMASSDIESLKVSINCEFLHIPKATSLTEFEGSENCYYFDENHLLNSYLSKYEDKLIQKFLIIKIGSLDVHNSIIVLKLFGYINDDNIVGNLYTDESLRPPHTFKIDNDITTNSNVVLKWISDDSVDYYEIERDGVIYTNIIGDSFDYADYTRHIFRIRSVLNNCSSKWSDYLEVFNKESQLIYNVQINCNLPSEPGEEIYFLTDGNYETLWHTDWGEEGKANRKNGKILKIFCDLGEIYHLDRIAYFPRENAGNGTFLEVQFRYSVDNLKWSQISNTLVFPQDNTVKIIKCGGKKMRYVELRILQSVGDYGSGRQMLFYKSNLILNEND